MGKRPRISKQLIGEIAVVDVFAFTNNKSSENARRVLTNVEKIEFDIWFDKHYYIREQHGDNDGKRYGIDRDLIQKLIVCSAKHLLFYSIKLKSFTFANFEVSIRNPRITITSEMYGEGKLNIVAEYHYLSINRYEVTVITALRKDNFRFNDGEYQVEIHKDGTSTLYKSERGKIKVIEEYTY